MTVQCSETLSEIHAIVLQGSNAATQTHQDLQSSFALASEAVDGA